MNTTTLADRRPLGQVLLRGLRELRWSGITVYFGFTALAAVAGGWAMSSAATATVRAYAGHPLSAVPFTALGVGAVAILAGLLLLVEVHSWGDCDARFSQGVVLAGSTAAALATGTITFLSATWLTTVQIPALEAFVTREWNLPEPGSHTPVTGPFIGLAVGAAVLAAAATAWSTYDTFSPKRDVVR